MMRSTALRCSISSRAAGPTRSACQNRPVFMRRLRPVMMLSSVDMPRNSAMFWKVRAMPCSAASCGRIWLRFTPL